MLLSSKLSSSSWASILNIYDLLLYRPSNEFHFGKQPRYSDHRTEGSEDENSSYIHRIKTNAVTLYSFTSENEILLPSLSSGSFSNQRE
jgi:hypothetical protein